MRRDQVRLMVLPRFDGAPIHTRFDALPEFLRPGDLLVVNNSRTLPALLQATDEGGRPVEVRLASRRAEDIWDVLLLDGRAHIGHADMRLSFGEGLSALYPGSQSRSAILMADAVRPLLHAVAGPDLPPG